jgi:peptidoglycan/xylan/chitin deacetylase (PgdA/CDA1 family)
MGGRLLVLGWHNVGASPATPVPHERVLRGFERQLDLVGRLGRVVPLGEALETLSRGGRLPARAVAITFDDGYRDNLEWAAPALERRGMPATFFLVPGLLSGGAHAWWERVAWAVTGARAGARWKGAEVPAGAEARAGLALRITRGLKALDAGARDGRVAALVEAMRPQAAFPERLFLDWEGARRLAGRGFAIGSHTTRHPILPRETPEAQRDEIAGARRELQARLGVDAALLAYPNGSYDAATLDAAAAAGHRWAVTTRWGLNDARTPPLEVRRMLVSPRRGAAGLARALAAGLRRRAGD